jgi:hypothetical protein
VNDIWSVMIEFRICRQRVRFGSSSHAKRSQLLPFSGALSSSNFPNDISLIELGLAGFCSHSISNVSTLVWMTPHVNSLYRLSTPVILALLACKR